MSIYLLSASVATPLLGRLGDQFGKPRMLIVTLALFTIGSVAAIFAWNIWSLIVFRAIQGIGGAVYPLSFSIIRDEVPAKRMGVAMGLISAMLGVGGGLGLVMSGVIVDHASWRLLFVVGAVIGVLGMALVARYVPPSPHRSPASLDIPGALLLSGGLILLLVALTEGHDWGWSSAKLMGMVAAGLAVLVVWGVVEARTKSPMVDMRMLSRRPVLFTNLAALFCGFTMYAIFTVLPLFSQMPSGLPEGVQGLVTYGFGATVTVSALYLLPGALVMLPAGPFGGVLGRWVGFKLSLAIGLVVTAIGSASLAAFHDEPWQLMLGYAIGAAGVAVAFGAMPKLIADAVSPTETGIATGMNTVVRTVGQRDRQPGRRDAAGERGDRGDLDPGRVRLHHLAVARRGRRAGGGALRAGGLAAATGAPGGARRHDDDLARYRSPSRAGVAAGWPSDVSPGGSSSSGTSPRTSGAG